jgi:hypothetical protein
MDYLKAGKVYLIMGLSLAACVFLSNLFSWCKGKKFKEPVYKSDKELAEEIHVPIRVIRDLRKKMIDSGFLIIEKRRNLKFNGATPYSLNLEKIRLAGNKEMCADLQKALTESVIGGGEKRQCHRRNPSQALTESVTSYIEAENTTEEYNREREEARARTSSPVLSPSPSFLDRFYSEWESCTGKVERQARIAQWLNVSNDSEKELAISNVARYVKAAKDSEKSLKHPYFYLADREFSKAYVVDTPLAIKETPATQSIIPNNNHSPEIQKQLTEEFGEPNYKSWFEQCQIVQSGCDIEVTAPNNFVKENVEELLGKSRFRRSYDSIKVMIAEFICVLLEYLEPIEQYCCV